MMLRVRSRRATLSTMSHVAAAHRPPALHPAVARDGSKLAQLAFAEPHMSSYPRMLSNSEISTRASAHQGQRCLREPVMVAFLREQVTVGVKGNLDGAVAHERLNSLGIEPLINQPRGIEVSQAVHTILGPRYGQHPPQLVTRPITWNALPSRPVRCTVMSRYFGCIDLLPSHGQALLRAITVSHEAF